MKVFVLVTTSCFDCNNQTVRVLSRKPTESEQDAQDEHNEIRLTSSWYSCARTTVFEIEIDGDFVSKQFTD